MLLYTMSIFYEPGKKLKWNRTFDTRFKERDQSVIMNTHQPFLFYEVRKIHKQTSKSPYYSSLILQLTHKQMLNAFITSIKGLRQTNFD